MHFTSVGVDRANVKNLSAYYSKGMKSVWEHRERLFQQENFPQINVVSELGLGSSDLVRPAREAAAGGARARRHASSRHARIGGKAQAHRSGTWGRGGSRSRAASTCLGLRARRSCTGGQRAGAAGGRRLVQPLVPGRVVEWSYYYLRVEELLLVLRVELLLDLWSYYLIC